MLKILMLTKRFEGISVWKYYDDEAHTHNLNKFILHSKYKAVFNYFYLYLGAFIAITADCLIRNKITNQNIFQTITTEYLIY